jgi:hypothetical protein
MIRNTTTINTVSQESERTVLAFLGGAVGLLIALWTLRAAYPVVLSFIPIPELATGLALNLWPDWRVFTFTLVIVAITGLRRGWHRRFNSRVRTLLPH